MWIFFLYWLTLIRPILVFQICFRFNIHINDKIEMLCYCRLMRKNGKEAKENTFYTIINLVRVWYDGLSPRERLCHPSRSHNRMVVGFTTTYAISAYHHWCCEFESQSGQGVQHYVIKFVCDLQQVGGFLRVLRVSTATVGITEILLKVELNTIKQTNKTNKIFLWPYV